MSDQKILLSCSNNQYEMMYISGCLPFPPLGGSVGPGSSRMKLRASVYTFQLELWFLIRLRGLASSPVGAASLLGPKLTLGCLHKASTFCEHRQQEGSDSYRLVLKILEVSRV